MKPDQHDFGVAMVFGQLLMISHAILQKKPNGFVVEVYKLHQHVLNLLADFTPKEKDVICADAYQMVMEAFPQEGIRGVLAECLAELHERIDNEAHQQDTHNSRARGTLHSS